MNETEGLSHALHRSARKAGLCRSIGSVAREHALFKRFPLDEEAKLSTGPAPTPYHVYDGHGIFLGGTADLDAVRELLAPEQVQAVHTVEGRALMGVWVFDFSDASLGAHHELQISLFVSEGPLAPVPSHRLSLLELMVTRPEVRMLCHGLWNNTPRVVAYNSELLSLRARESVSRIKRDMNSFDFAVRDKELGTSILQGRIHRPLRGSLRANFSFATLLGLRQMAALARQPWINVPVLNPVNETLTRNATAQTFTQSRTSVLRYFDAKRDSLVFGDTPYGALHFKPLFGQYMEGFKFVYLFPE